MYISVVLPVKKEPYAKQLEYDIYNHLGKNCEVLFQHEEGLSNAVRHGIQRAKGKVIAVMDADGSHSPFYILPMAMLLNKHNHLVIGYKHINHDTFIRRQTSKLFRLIICLLLHLKLHDPLSGFIVGYKQCFRFKERKGFKYGLEVILANEEHIAEFPIIFEKRKSGRSKVTPLEGIRTLFKILKLSVETGRILPRLPKTLRQTIRFMLVGTGGVIVNGVTYALLSQFAMFRTVPFPFWVFKEITLSWGIGILTAFFFNFALSKCWVFRNDRDE